MWFDYIAIPVLVVVAVTFVVLFIEGNNVVRQFENATKEIGNIAARCEKGKSVKIDGFRKETTMIAKALHNMNWISGMCALLSAVTATLTIIQLIRKD